MKVKNDDIVMVGGTKYLSIDALSSLVGNDDRREVLQYLIDRQFDSIIESMERMHVELEGLCKTAKGTGVRYG